jgi:hypothetical protein
MEVDNFEKLRELLALNEVWPLKYMFKFIVPNNSDKVKQVTAILPKHGDTTYKHTKNLTYVSVTCRASMETVESIIEVNTQATNISGVIML